jgi:hypothetical protein
MPDRFCYYSELENKWYGKSRSEWHDILKGTDLVLCVSGVTPFRDEFKFAGRTCVIDTDPVYTQLRMRTDREFLAYYESFDRVATFGTEIGTDECVVPTAGLDWISTHQPVAMNEWPVATSDSRVFSTMGVWDHGPGRQFEFHGRMLRSSKGVQWMALAELPTRTSFDMRMAMVAVPPATAAQFEANGWTFTDSTADSLSPASYREFIQRQAGEFTVAKHIYVELPSGWFSDRSACYLASGKPVVTQPTGFDKWLPVGEGLLSYLTIDEAAAALKEIEGDYARHAHAARALAEEYFDSRKVLHRLLADIG